MRAFLLGRRGKPARGMALCCAAHLAVDLACAFLMLGRPGVLHPAWFLLYNGCAFALQMPFGLLAGRGGRPLRLAAAGCLLVAGAYPFFALPAVAVPAAGVGNALFHVGAGLSVLRAQRERCGPLGLFVSPGALGLSLGAALAAMRETAGLPLAFLPPALLLCAGLLLCRISAGPPQGALPGEDGLPSPGGPLLSENPWSVGGSLSAGGAGPQGPLPRGVLFPAACLFFVVCLRSLLTLSLPWKGTGLWGAALAGAAVLGKALGGLAADRFGLRRVSLGALALSVPLLLFCALPLPGLMAVLLLNMTMPVTLWALARRMPQMQGFAFGLLTFALFLGFLPGFLQIIPSLTPAGAAAGAAASLLLLGAGLWRQP